MNRLIKSFQHGSEKNFLNEDVYGYLLLVIGERNRSSLLSEAKDTGDPWTTQGLGDSTPLQAKV